jgi:hypothetical protein
MIKKPISNFKFQILKYFLVTLIFLAIAVCFPATVKAATIYLDPPQAVIGPNDVIEVKVKIGVGIDECVNAVQVGLTFPSDTLELKDFNSGDSFLSLWAPGGKPDQAAMPAINQAGKIIFAGGIPGGYCGVIPGDTGESNVLGSLIFTAKKPITTHQAKIDFSQETQAYLNDGSGTQDSINTQGVVLRINENIASATDAWAQTIADDKTPPEPFMIEISNSPRIAGGKSFVVFSTVDKQTGVDHYEVLEAKTADLLPKTESAWDKFFRRIFNIKEPLSPAWTRATSPYVLNDQSLNSVIEVKAIDRAGNERIVQYDNAALKAYKNPQPTIDWQPIIYLGACALLVIIVAVLIVVMLRKKGRRRNNT